MGESRMAGKIFAALMLTEHTQTSSSELVKTLGISNSSVSIATRDLIAHGLIERVGVPGERQAFFRVNSDAGELAQFIIEAGRQMRKIEQMIAWGQELVKDKDPSVVKRFEGLHELLEFVQGELDMILVNWQKHKGKGG
jgi:DNA-binding transcriptional regulator GbsR (MarR family)